MQWYEPWLCCVENAVVQKPWRILLPLLCGELTGAFHSTQNSGNFDWYINHFDLVRPEYSGPALKVVHFDWSGYLGRSDRNVPFPLTKLLFSVPLFCVRLTRIITKRAVDWVWSVQPECNVPLDIWNCEISNRNLRWIESALDNRLNLDAYICLKVGGRRWDKKMHSAGEQDTLKDQGSTVSCL